MLHENTPSPHVRNIWLDLLATILTLGLFNVYLQYRQMQALNAILGAQRYRFWPWLGLTIVTLTIYHFYHEFRMCRDLERALGEKSPHMTVMAVAAVVIGIFPIADALQQQMINRLLRAPQRRARNGRLRASE